VKINNVESIKVKKEKKSSGKTKIKSSKKELVTENASPEKTVKKNKSKSKE
jgi:hypothetical protein